MGHQELVTVAAEAGEYRAVWRGRTAVYETGNEVGFVHTYTYIYIYTHTHIYIYTYTHIYMHDRGRTAVYETG